MASTSLHITQSLGTEPEQHWWDRGECSHYCAIPAPQGIKETLFKMQKKRAVIYYFTTITCNLAIWLDNAVRVNLSRNVIANQERPFWEIKQSYCKKVVDKCHVVDLGHDFEFVVDSLDCASWVHNILTTVMTNIVVDKSTDNAEPHSIC